MARRSTKARKAAQRRKINVEALGMMQRGEMSPRAYTSAVETGTLPALVENTRRDYAQRREEKEREYAFNAAKIDPQLRMPCDGCGLRRRGVTKVGAALICPGCLRGISVAA